MVDTDVYAILIAVGQLVGGVATLPADEGGSIGIIFSQSSDGAIETAVVDGMIGSMSMTYKTAGIVVGGGNLGRHVHILNVHSLSVE